MGLVWTRSCSFVVNAIRDILENFVRWISITALTSLAQPIPLYAVKMEIAVLLVSAGRVTLECSVRLSSILVTQIPVSQMKLVLTWAWVCLSVSLNIVPPPQCYPDSIQALHL